MKTIKHNNTTLLLEFGEYNNGNNALELIEKKTGDCYMVASSNLDIVLAKDEILIKDYSENAGILKTLTEAGILKDTEKTIDLGFVKLNICKIV